MPFYIIRGDITKLGADAIVNAANATLEMGGGVCGAIFNAAGAEQLQKACDKLAPIETGGAVITDGFNLPAKHIIHTAGPVYRGGGHGEEGLLRSCYTRSLELASGHKCKSVAFPLISSGIYGYPKSGALRVAASAIRDYINHHDIDVYLVIFDGEPLLNGEGLSGGVGSYISDHYTDTRHEMINEFDAGAGARYFAEPRIVGQSVSKPPDVDFLAAEIPAIKAAGSLADLTGNLDEPFSVTLLRLIDAKGKTDAEVYRRANVDRRLFSKIRGNKNYMPSKPTVMAFAIALELNLDQTADLLKRAGFAFSHSRIFDVIVEYFIQKRIYDIDAVNMVLFEYDQPLLGGV